MRALKLPLLRNAFVILCVGLLLPVFGCARQTQKHTSEYYDLFDTYTSFTSYTKSEDEFEKYSDVIYNEMLRLHRIFDKYHDYIGVNNLKTINDNAGIAPVKVDPDLIDLLEKGVAAYADTDGAVNIALGPVLKIWHDYREAAWENPKSAALPPVDELKQAAELAVITGLEIDRENSTVFLKKSGMSLDVGALAKGYAAAKAVELTKQAGMVSGLLNAGGNVVAVGVPLDGRDFWSVLIESPDSGYEGQTLEIKNQSVVTSGDYQRFYMLNGERYHHIIDPKTLMPANRCRSVTIIHPDGTTADILSTAAFIMPADKAARLVEQHGGRAIWILQNEDGTFKTVDSDSFKGTF